jgi:glycosyltransferase involved in cell wall biosynthesis
VKKSDAIIFIGPLPPPVNGHSLAFQYAFQGFNGNKRMISQNWEGKRVLYKVFFSFWVLFKYLACFIKYRRTVIYIAGSRSISGALKDILAIYMAKWFSSKIVLHIHAAYFDKFLDGLPFLIRGFYLKAYRHVNCFIALHECMLNEYNRFMPGSRLEVVHNFYDPVLELPDPFVEKTADRFRILFLSNLVFSKGILQLVEAFKKLQLKHSNLELYVAGAFQKDDHYDEVWMKEEFEKKTKGVSGIKYYGMVQGERKASLLRCSHIFVLPSFYSSEAMPISILEACRAGCAIVTTDHHYLKQLVDESMGICVRPNSVDDLVAGLDRLICHPELLRRMGMNNLEYSKNNFTLALYQKKINSLLIQLSDGEADAAE